MNSICKLYNFNIVFYIKIIPEYTVSDSGH